MKKTKTIICIIPARLHSTRFPQKILAPLDNKPLLQWTWQAACCVPHFSAIFFAIDHIQTAHAIERFGGSYLTTAPTCQSGTDRIVEIMRSGKIKGDIWLNWQVDHPFATINMIETLLQSCQTDSADIWTLKKQIEHIEEISSPHTTKVVCDENDFALYFSRSPIPYHTNTTEQKKEKYFKHIGLYAYTTSALQKIAETKMCPLEQTESLEQLRFLYHQLSIKVHETTEETIDINVPEDIEKAKKYLHTMATHQSTSRA